MSAPSWRDAIGGAYLPTASTTQSGGAPSTSTGAATAYPTFADTFFAGQSYGEERDRRWATTSSAASQRSLEDLRHGWQDVMWLALQQFTLQAIANPFFVSKLLLQCQYVPTEDAENPRSLLYTPPPSRSAIDAASDDEEEAQNEDNKNDEREEEEEEEERRGGALSVHDPLLRKDMRSLAKSLDQTPEEKARRNAAAQAQLTSHSVKDADGYFASGPLLAPQRSGPWRMQRRLVDALGFSGLWRGTLIGFASRIATSIIQPSLEAALNDHFCLFDEGLVPIVQLDSPWANYGTLCLSQSITHFLLLPLDVLYTRAVLDAPASRQRGGKLPVPAQHTEKGPRPSLWQRVTTYYPHPWTSLLYFTMMPLLKNLSPLLLGQWMHITNPWVYGIAAFSYCTLELLTLMPLQTACRRLWAQGWAAEGWQFISLRRVWSTLRGWWDPSSRRRDDETAAEEEEEKRRKAQLRADAYEQTKANTIVQLSPISYSSSRDLIFRIVREEGRIWRILAGAFFGQFEGLYRCFWVQSMTNVALIALATLSRLEVDEDDFVE